MDDDSLYYELVAFVENLSDKILTRKDLKAFRHVIKFIKDYE